MTPQEAFDRVWDWFVVQGNGPSTAPVGEYGSISFRYRGANGARCAVGLLMSDEEYLQEMEGMVVAELRDRLLLPDGIAEMPQAFLDRLQNAHDYAATESDDNLVKFRERVRAMLTCVGKDAGLVVPETGGAK